MNAQTASIPILISLCFCHLLNDLIQSLIPALYPLLKEQFSLDFTQIGIITLAFQMTASLLQPTATAATDASTPASAVRKVAREGSVAGCMAGVHK